MEQVNLCLPFTSAILTSTSYQRSHGRKQIRYKGYHELAYLHPNQLSRLFLNSKAIYKENDRFTILLRIVSWSASHDINQKGMSNEFILQFIEMFKSRAQLFISCEGEVPEQFKQYLKASGDPEVHAFLNTLDLYVGEGATMASECALLGVPAIYINSMQAGTIDDQEKAGLLYHISDEKGILEKTDQLLNERALRSIHQERAHRFIQSKIDVSAFLVWFIENWPVSMKIMKENPDYQNRFNQGEICSPIKSPNRPGKQICTQKSLQLESI